jgi:soluble lytic murein transglycosylase-like protein
MLEKHRKEAPKWRGGEDWRVVCSCQTHRRGSNFLGSALRGAARGAAVLVSIPLALAVVDISSATSKIDLTILQRAEPVQQQVQRASALQIFTTEKVKADFLAPVKAQGLEVFKESYFSSHVPFGAIIYREARRNNLPPELVAAMVHTESDFRPGLVSHKSAQGLMQIIPSTARILGIDDPFDPEKNIAAGTKYYRYLLDRFDDEAVALAAYNAGEGNVARFGGIPPFEETRNYISRVNRRTRRYRENLRNSYLASVRVTPDVH